MDGGNMSRDLRKYERQTNYRLIVGAVMLLFVIGDGLIYIIYGKNAALTGFFCILAGMIPVALTVLVLLLLDWIRKRADHD
jgi:hypothetical protein